MSCILRASAVLEDCRSALASVEEAETNQQFRLRWVALVALLRTVGHVLHKVDGFSNPDVQREVELAWARWKAHRQEHAIFWDFIEEERNSILKAYEFGTNILEVEQLVGSQDPEELVLIDAALFRPLSDGAFAGQDGRDVARDAITWWEQQLSDIQANVRRHRRN